MSDTSERGELAALIWGATDSGPNLRDSDLIADAIIAAGWKPPPAPHEHDWHDPRDLINPPDICGVCGQCTDQHGPHED